MSTDDQPTVTYASDTQQLTCINQKFPNIPGYHFEAEIGRGGMGIVYRVREKSRGTVLALKMVLHCQQATFQELARFRVEAEAMACLDHPNIIRIHDIGVAEGYPFISLELAERGCLKRITQQKPQPLRWSTNLVLTLALAIHHAHGRGMLHRDLKPANILIMEDGAPKISDFGLVKFAAPIKKVRSASLIPDLSLSEFDQELNRLAQELNSQFLPLGDGDLTPENEAIRIIWQQSAERTGLLGDKTKMVAVREFLTATRQRGRSVGRHHQPNLDQLTRSGTVLGTTNYMAPEQAFGDLRKIGRQTDVYALGGILYELLTGHPPFQAKTFAEYLSRISSGSPRPLHQIDPKIPKVLDGICLKCLEKDIDRRYPTAAALAEDLQEVFGKTENKWWQFWKKNRI